jgi:cell division protein FtsX
MSKRTKDVTWVAVLSVICGLLILHVIHWHYTGMYLELFEWVQTSKGYITVFYNLGLMLGLGAVLGFLMKKITDLVGYEVHEIKHF